MRIYSNPERENLPYALPDIEVFYVTEAEAEAEEYNSLNETEELYPSEGWYWWSRFPGCLPDSDPFGPFDSEAEAIEDVRNF